MEITFLGTGAAMPTVERNLSAVNINFEGSNYLFDAPECVQRQIVKAEISYLKINAIFLSHFHADHILGLTGLLATMIMQDRQKELYIFGPKGVNEKVNEMIKLGKLNVDFEIIAKEIKEGVILKEKNFRIEAVRLKHGCKCYGFIFKEKDKLGKFQREKALALGIPEGPLFSKLQEGKTIKLGNKTIKPQDVLDLEKGRKGRKVAIIIDTRKDEHYIKKIKNCDILIHEATFLHELINRAKETKHSTALEAAEVAKKAGCKKLYLTHLSARYKNAKVFEEEARKVFANSFVAKDLMRIKVERNPEGRII